MPQVLSRFATGAARRLLCWLLALVVSMQGVAAGMAAVEGPMHAHRWADRSSLLEDFRRHLPEDGAQRGGLRSWLGHLHEHASPQRHHHSPGDASVLRTGDDALPDSINVDGGTGGSGTLASFLALIPTPHAWHDQRVAQSVAAGSLWAATIGFRGRLERPPRAN